MTVRTGVFTPSRARDSPGGLVRMQVLVPQVWGRARASAFLPSAPVTLLVHGPHGEEPDCRFYKGFGLDPQGGWTQTSTCKAALAQVPGLRA